MIRFNYQGEFPMEDASNVSSKETMPASKKESQLGFFRFYLNAAALNQDEKILIHDFFHHLLKNYSVIKADLSDDEKEKFDELNQKVTSALIMQLNQLFRPLMNREQYPATRIEFDKIHEVLSKFDELEKYECLSSDQIMEVNGAKKALEEFSQLDIAA